MFRKIALGIVVTMLAAMMAEHHHGQIKGGDIPFAYVTCAVVCSTIAALICLRFSRIATPFVAGVAGVFSVIEPQGGPYGGIVGLLVGTAVLVLSGPPRNVARTSG